MGTALICLGRGGFPPATQSRHWHEWPRHLSKKLRLPGGSLTGMQSTGTMTPSSVAKTFAGRMSNTTASSPTNAYALRRDSPPLPLPVRCCGTAPGGDPRGRRPHRAFHLLIELCGSQPRRLRASGPDPVQVAFAPLLRFRCVVGHHLATWALYQEPAFSQERSFPQNRTLMPRSGDVPQSPEGVEDGGDLGGALLGLASETGGEDFRFLTGGGQQLADGDHLRGQFGGPRVQLLLVKLINSPEPGRVTSRHG